eukprot:jgi/Ulvmu1/6309/UM029_0016.1
MHGSKHLRHIALKVAPPHTTATLPPRASPNLTAAAHIAALSCGALRQAATSACSCHRSASAPTYLPRIVQSAMSAQQPFVAANALCTSCSNTNPVTRAVPGTPLSVSQCTATPASQLRTAPPLIRSMPEKHSYAGCAGMAAHGVPLGT